MASVGTYLRDQKRNLPLVISKDACRGHTYIVTGANVGLGFEVAKHLVEMDSHRVILAVRTPSNGEEAKSKIERETGKKGIAEVWQLDLSKYASVKAFAARAVSELDRIDGLIENAAVAVLKWATAEGNELSVTVNIISTFLLAVSLLPKLSETATKFDTTPQLTLVSSETGFWASAKTALEKIRDDPFRKMNDREFFEDRYPLSKCIESIAVFELARRAPLSKTGVVIDVVNPGLCRTTLMRDGNLAMKMALRTMNFFIGRSAEMGSRAILHAAFTGKEGHGAWCNACEIRR
jgi:NAD(P)-dependent dehydrogenase (short-subunit alcohol dehydrogenase family)